MSDTTPPDAEGTPAAPADAEATPTTPVDEATTDAPAATDPEAPDAENEVTALPADWEGLADADLTTLFNELGASINEAKALDPTEITAETVATAKAQRTAQDKIAALLQTRIDERAANKLALDSLDDDAPTLPETPVSSAPKDAKPADKPEAKAASAAAQPVSTAAPVTAQDAIAARESVIDAASPVTNRRALTAAVAATSPRWLSTRDGDAASWIDLVNGSRPAAGGRDGIEARPKESVMASAKSDVPSYDDMLTDSPSHNERVIALARERHYDERRSQGTPARMAAICDPATILRDAMVIGTDATPFQNSLVGLTAQSGNALKFQYRLPTSISEAVAGVGEWTTGDQAAIDRTDPDTWKPCVEIACPGYDTQSATEITACYEIDAFTELSSPEAEADFVWAKDRAFARYTEGWHIRKADSWLRWVSFNGYTGAVPSVIEAILSSIASGDYGERLDPGTYTVFGSPGLLYALAIDENTKAYRQNLTAALDDVRQIVEDATGCSYVQLLDLELDSGGALKSSPFGSFGSVGAGSATVMPRLSSVGFTMRILDPSSIVAFNTGEAVFGEQITLDQARRNHRGLFQRIFGGQMKPGITPGYKVSVTLCTDGSRGGFVEPGCPPTGFVPSGSGSSFVATPAG